MTNSGTAQTGGFDLAAQVGIHVLPLPTNFPVGPVNSYLIDDEPLTLVDAGPNSATTLEVLETGVRALGHEIEDLGLIVVTHQHLDHTGLVGVLQRRSGAEVAALAAAKPLLADYQGSARLQSKYMGEMLEAHGWPETVRTMIAVIGRRMNVSGADVDVTVPLTPGEDLQLRDRTLTVLHRPGHSPSDTVFFDQERRMMISGDHLIGHISSNPLVTLPLSGEPVPRPQALVTYMASLEATAGEEIELVLPGHGDAVREHRELIESRFAGYGRRRERLYELISESPRSAYELAVELWGGEAEKQATLTLSEVLGHVDLLLNDGAVVEQIGADGVVSFAAA